MKTVRDILEEYRFGKHDKKSGLRLETMDIDQAIKEIDAFYKSKVPKKKRFNSQAKDIEQSNRDVKMYNQCIADFHKEE